MLIPTLPGIALAEAKIHMASHKLAVHRIVEQRRTAQCQNCQDDSVVYVSFLGVGPTKQPVTNTKPSTYVEGDGYAKKGWYQIERTVAYPCPLCFGERTVRLPGAVRPEVRAEAQQVMDQLTRRVEIGEKAAGWIDD